MSKKLFFSQLFDREIKPDNKYYWSIVYAEALYRYYDLVERNCPCFECKNNRETLSEYLKTHKYNRKRNELDNAKRLTKI